MRYYDNAWISKSKNSDFLKCKVSWTQNNKKLTDPIQNLGLSQMGYLAKGLYVLFVFEMSLLSGYALEGKQSFLIWLKINHFGF